MKFNANDIVRVRLTEAGRKKMLQCGSEVASRIPRAGEPYDVQLWVLMSGLGEGMGMGSVPLIERNELELVRRT